ncbi:unnamed protein product [Coregonus sp. 'balchen']|nr:unnamed protein product [Coregonus sp. 'balchen']
MASLLTIKNSGDSQPSGSFLGQLHPMGLGAFNIKEEERESERPSGEDQDQEAVLGSGQRGGVGPADGNDKV